MYVVMRPLRGTYKPIPASRAVIVHPTANLTAPALPKMPELGWGTTRNRDRILRAVCRLNRVSLDELKSRSHARRIVRVRQQAMYLLRTRLRMSFSSIGRLLNRDHTTVLHGVRAHAERTGAPLPKRPGAIRE
jgi:chromosomal replication initiation ATPase DnaA